jgi:hypothetical protein
MMETIRDKTAMIVYRGGGGSVWLFPAIGEKACECSFSVRYILSCSTHYSILFGRCPLDEQGVQRFGDWLYFSSSGKKKKKGYFVKPIR